MNLELFTIGAITSQHQWKNIDWMERGSLFLLAFLLLPCCLTIIITAYIPIEPDMWTTFISVSNFAATSCFVVINIVGYFRLAWAVYNRLKMKANPLLSERVRQESSERRPESFFLGILARGGCYGASFLLCVAPLLLFRIMYGIDHEQQSNILTQSDRCLVDAFGASQGTINFIIFGYFEIYRPLNVRTQN